jgi:hypothetical protein
MLYLSLRRVPVTLICAALLFPATAIARDGHGSAGAWQRSAEYYRQEALALSLHVLPPTPSITVYRETVRLPVPDLGARIARLGRLRTAYCEMHAVECAKGN